MEEYHGGGLLSIIPIAFIGIVAIDYPSLRFSALAVGVSRVNKVPADRIIGRLVVHG